MDFSYYDSKNKINKIEISAGSKWNDIKVNNPAVQSIFDKIRGNNDTITEKNINLLKDLMDIADNKTSISNSNGVIDTKEAETLSQMMDNSSKSRVIDTSKNETLKYSYIDTFDDEIAIMRNFDSTAADTSNLPKGKYYLNFDGVSSYDDKGVSNERLEPIKMQNNADIKEQNWSEGLNREIRTIKMSDSSKSENFEKVKQEMNYIGKELGFKVETVHSADIWVEDYTVRRADGKVYAQSKNEYNFINKEEIESIQSRRSDIGTSGQGSAAINGKTSEYIKTVPEDEIVKSNTYLEGGNVLNTLKADGKPGAVIGEESIGYTLKSMGLEDTPDNRIKAKNQIASDLGLKPEDITYIPQFDFHIDMTYHPLGNGEMAVPDYQAGIDMLKNTKISEMSEDQKQHFIDKLEEMKEKTASITKDAEASLTKAGYKLVKIPCFTVPKDDSVPQVNFANGVGGTSKMKGTFFITNSSGYPELNEAASKVFKQNGVKNVYFVSSGNYLKLLGGIDCMTQEI